MRKEILVCCNHMSQNCCHFSGPHSTGVPLLLQTSRTISGFTPRLLSVSVWPEQHQESEGNVEMSGESKLLLQSMNNPSPGGYVVH